MKKFFVVVLLVCGWVGIWAAEAPIGIIGALEDEVRLLESKLQDKRISVYLGLNYAVGKLNGHPVVLVRSGMGKVNAAAATAILLERYKPTAVIFTGIAGGIEPGIQPGDIVIGEKLIQYDYGTFLLSGLKTEPTVNPSTDRPNPLVFTAAADLVRIARSTADGIKFTPLTAGGVEHKPTVRSGVIVTGDAFVASAEKSDELRQRFRAMAVEMEGAAVAQVCWQRNCPFIVIRSISDSANGEAEADLRRFYRIAAENSSRLTEAIVNELAR